MAQYYDAALAPAGLKGTQVALLNAVSLLDRPGMQRLAAALGMDRTTLTRNLRPLEVRALVALWPGEDQRERHVSLTGAGRATLAEALRLWEAAQEQLVSRLGADRARRVLDDLEDLSALARDA